jgi:hypothetical protein
VLTAAEKNDDRKHRGAKHRRREIRIGGRCVNRRSDFVRVLFKREAAEPEISFRQLADEFVEQWPKGKSTYTRDEFRRFIERETRPQR